MFRVNENYLKLPGSYLFSTIAKKVAAYQKENPDKKLIRLGIGDVTLPIAPAIIEAMHKAVDEIGTKEGFKGYGPEQGYDFLKEKIIRYDYNIRGINLDLDEVFISDGSKCDVGNIVDLFAKENLVAITDPVYPVYLDTNIIAGRDEIKNIDLDNNNLSGIILMPCNKDNSFVPKIPNKIPDIIYLCYPNNPTGIALEKSELKKWVDFAKKNNSIILFDSAYEAFITESNIPHSIYEIEGAKEVI